MSGPFPTYAEFWPHYLREHARPATRALHYLGTALGVSAVVAALFLSNPLLFLIAALCGYGPAWIGHFFIERNRPATFRHPLWSFISDFRMVGLALTGRLGPELEKAGIE